jgi:hypothetical protein
MRGQRIVYVGDDREGTNTYPAVILRVRPTGAIDIAVFFQRDVIMRNSVLHVSKNAGRHCWDYAPAEFDWESRAA